MRLPLLMNENEKEKKSFILVLNFKLVDYITHNFTSHSPSNIFSQFSSVNTKFFCSTIFRDLTAI